MQNTVEQLSYLTIKENYIQCVDNIVDDIARDKSPKELGFAEACKFI